MFAFLALPGIFAFALPLSMIEPHWQEPARFDRLGLIPLATGIVLLLGCIREFYVAGHGTLAPWAPPQRLVTSGLYRFSRNPMYVAVVLMLVGWATVFHSTTLAVYALGVGLIFYLRVIFGEEPWLAQMYGERWTRYKAEVPRWFGMRWLYSLVTHRHNT